MRAGKPSSNRTVLLGVSFLSGIGLLMAVQGATEAFLAHPVFVVRQVEVEWSGEAAAAARRPNRYRLNPPTSVFRMSLDSLREAFQRRYPAGEVLEVRRILPHRILARIRLRRVVAQVQANGAYYPVSDDGTVVSAGLRSPHPRLPVVLLNGLRRAPAAGRNLNHAGFWKASDLLVTIQYQGGVLAGRRIQAVHAGDQELRLVLDHGPEIRLASDRVAEGWGRLADLISQRPQVLSEASYLDLRFEDPVIGQKKPGKKPSRRRG